jgi:uncharacterized protein (DUF2252 family)
MSAIAEELTTPSVPHPSLQERVARGKAARAEIPRRSHAGWDPPPARRDPVEVLEEQAETRVPELVPIRYGRMLTSPFAFYRGAAAIMAGDLAGTPRTGLQVQLCGDAHLSNFGGFASPERDLVFDINDFDETHPGPWEWDVKRLAASMEIAGRELGFTPGQRRRAVLAAVRTYRDAMRAFAQMRNLEVWYARLDAAAILSDAGLRFGAKTRDAIGRRAAKARTKDSMRALAKLTQEVDGERRFVSDPPLLVTVEDLLPGAAGDAVRAEIQQLLVRYRATLRSDRRHLFDAYRFVDLARKVVGVGSVGTRAWVVLLVGRDADDPLVLQVKEAVASVLEPYTAAPGHPNQGQRVVEGQWLMQSSSDTLLGWLHAAGLDGQERDFYVRQLWDWKVSAAIETMGPALLAAYGELCGWTLARGHARSGDRVAIASYLGSGTAFDDAVATFADAYAEQNERDFARLRAAAQDGTITVVEGM